MIESFTLFLCLVYLWLYMSARKGYNYWPWLCAATIIGIFAATSKVTTFFTFAIFVSLIMLVDLYKYNKSKQLLKRMPRLAVSVLSLAIPTAAVFIWTKYSDYIKSQNPLANNFITSDSLTRWNFGTWEQKTDLSIWETILSRQIELGIGSIAALLVALTVLVCFKDQKRLMIFFLCIGLFLVAPVVFTNLHYVHEYYAYANSLFLVIAISCSVEAWISRPGKYYFITGLALLLFFSFNQIYKYRTSFYFSQQSKNFTFPQSTTEPISKHTNPDDIIYVVGQDWNSIYAYYSRRRAIMDRYNLSTDSNLFKEVINNTGKNNIGAFIACRELKGDRKMFVDKLSFFGFSEIPINAGACEIYLPKDKA